MPLDAICLRALTNELRGQLLGARVDKVQQPARDQIVLLLRGNLRLLINAGPNQPRVQLTRELRENPAEPPMLCMLLRKHLVGGRIMDIEQSGLERIVTFTIRNVNELGESGTRKLVIEAMSRRSNLILLDEEHRTPFYANDALTRGKAGGFHLLSHHAVRGRNGTDGFCELFRDA